MLKKPGKQYGLIKRNKKPETKLVASKLSFFNDDEEDEELDGKKKIEQELKKTAAQKKINKQTQLDIQRALEQDASIYDYDGVYDEMKNTKEESEAQKKPKDKKPKYMQALLKTAERRQQLHERRTERKVQKEREAEGDEFADKEIFVTANYKKKLLEFEEQEKEEELQDLKERIMDVTKQRDMSGFYKHHLNRTARVPSGLEEEKKDEQKKDINTESEEQIQQRAKEARTQFKQKDNHLGKKFRTTRTGEDEESSEEEEEESQDVKHEPDQTVKTEISEPNPDADTDVESSSDEENDKTVKHDPDNVIKTEDDIKGDPDTPKEAKLETGQRENETLAEFKLRLKKKKERNLAVYQRRNTDETVEAARKRFQERRLERKMAGRPI